MQLKSPQFWSVNQLFLLLATFSITLAALKYAAEIVVPFLLAGSIAILLTPLLNYLETRRVPKAVSLILVTLTVLVPLIGVGIYVGREVHDFGQNYHEIQQSLESWLAQVLSFFNKIGVSMTSEDIDKALSSANFSEMIKGMVSQVQHQFSNIFLIFFLVAFMLMESDSLYAKLQKIMQDRGGDVDEGMQMVTKIKEYFLIKVKTSLMTGLWILLVLWFYDIRYALLWASLAFFLNFVPVIGSIIAAIPAVVMALIDQSLMTATWVALGYIAANTVIGNIIEPRIMGKGLGLSALVIFLSMTFWGWMFGPVGMILSVPLTMGMQYLFEHYDETKWVALMLSDYQQSDEKKRRNDHGKKNDNARRT